MNEKHEEGVNPYDRMSTEFNRFVDKGAEGADVRDTISGGETDSRDNTDDLEGEDALTTHAHYASTLLASLEEHIDSRASGEGLLEELFDLFNNSGSSMSVKEDSRKLHAHLLWLFENKHISVKENLTGIRRTLKSLSDTT